MISSTPCVGCWRYSPIYIPSERSTGPGLVDYCYRPSRGQKREGFGIAVGGADVLLSPLPAAWVVGVADDLLNGIINIDLGVPQLNLTVAQHRPSSTRTAVRHPMLPELITSRRSTRRTNSCACDPRPQSESQLAGRRRPRPTFQASINQHHLFVVSRGAVTKHHRPEAVDIEHDGMRKLAQQSHLVASELPGSPHQLRMVTRAALRVRPTTQQPKTPRQSLGQ